MKKNREQLILSHLNLVNIIAAQIVKRSITSLPYEDLVQIGRIGLIKAADNYKKSKSKFSTYANIRIFGEIMDGIRENGNISRNQSENLKSILFAINLELVSGKKLDLKRIAKITGIRREDIDHLLNYLEDPEFGLIDDRTVDIPDEILINKQHGLIIEEAMMMKLKHREEVVLRLYFYSDIPLLEIARMMDLTESRVSQIKDGALKKLKFAISNKIPDLLDSF